METWLKPTSPTLGMFFLMESSENLLGGNFTQRDSLCTMPPFCTCWHFRSCSSCCLNILFYPLWLRTGVIPPKKHFLSLFNLDLPISDSVLPPSRLDIFLCVPLQPIKQKFLKCSGYVSVLSAPPNFSYCWLTAGIVSILFLNP